MDGDKESMIKMERGRGKVREKLYLSLRASLMGVMGHFIVILLLRRNTTHLFIWHNVAEKRYATQIQSA